MGFGASLTNEVTAWGVLAITIVLVLIILGQFKTVPGGSATTNSTIDDFITGLSEPANWVAIVIIALIGFGIIKFVKDKS